MLGNPHIEKGREMIRFFNIVEVYGPVTDTRYYHLANQISVVGRDLLWTTTPVKKMTIAEIEKRLGHKVEIVEE
jgi:N-dimethylarginine dimethylaminohydrolase